MAEHKAEEYKGRAKEAIGDMTDDEELKREGKTEQGAARFKQKAEEATDKVTDALKGDEGDEQR